MHFITYLLGQLDIEFGRRRHLHFNLALKAGKFSLAADCLSMATHHGACCPPNPPATSQSPSPTTLTTLHNRHTCMLLATLAHSRA
jgi:hypothetical protein